MTLFNNVFEKMGIIRYTNSKKKKEPKVIMTLQCRDEIDMIEYHIRFHMAMGIDGIIVTDHNSVDGTREVLEKLKKEGLVLKIIDVQEYTPAENVNRMIDIAVKEYQADWVINSDADEFYVPKNENIKEQLPTTGVNVLRVFSNFYCPIQENLDISSQNAYFIKRPLKEYELALFGMEKNLATEYYIGDSCPKVIHNTKDFVEITRGNHFVKMKRYNEIETSGIILYHYHTRNYESLEKKAIKSIKGNESNLNPKSSQGWKRYAALYEQGKLKELYEARFGKEMFEKLRDAGVVCKDPTVANIILNKGIKKKYS